MDNHKSKNPYDITGRVAGVTGGASVLCSAQCRMLATVSVKVAILDLNARTAESLAAEIRSSTGEVISLACNILDKGSIE